MTKTQKALTGARLAIFLFSLFFTALSVHGAQRQCSEIFLTPEQIQTYTDWKSEIFPTPNLEEDYPFINDPTVPSQEQASYFLDYISKKNVSSLVELAQVLAVISEMSIETASNIILQTESFAGFNQRTGLQGGALEDYGKALFLNILRKDEVQLEEFYGEQSGTSKGLNQSPMRGVEPKNQFMQLVNSNLGPQTRALTLISQSLRSSGLLGQYATYRAALNIKNDSTKMEVVQAVLESFQDIYKNFILNKRLDYRETKDYFLSHVLALQAISRPANKHDLELTNVDIDLNQQMIATLEALRTQFPISSNLPSLTSVRSLYKGVGDHYMRFTENLVLIIDEGGPDFRDFIYIPEHGYAYNTEKQITQTRILPHTNLDYYRRVIERHLKEILRFEEAKSKGRSYPEGLAGIPLLI